jgi:hypothetical protein
MTKLNNNMRFSELTIHQKINANSAFRDTRDVREKEINECFYRAPYPSWYLSKENKDPPPTKPILKKSKKVTYKDFRQGWKQLANFKL